MPGRSPASSETDFEIRAALPQDRAALLELARHLNSVNLPADGKAITRLLDISQASFAGELRDEAQHRYVFLLSHLPSGRVVGTSSIVAQLGTPSAPYIYFDVSSEEKYSRDLDLHFEHQVLRLGFSYDGPTELAGLVVDPRYRRHPGRLGLAISYIRFLYIAAHRPRFQDQLLAELLPPLEPDGTSHLWNALGRRFTNMTYREADRLSHENKDFIRDLFPTQTVYASLLNEAAQSVIGKVGHQTKGVEKMLRRIGFEYAERVDPFDGGPHFVADTDDVVVIRSHQALIARQLNPMAPAMPPSGALIVASLTPQAPYVRACHAPQLIDGEQLLLSTDVLNHLRISPGATVHAVTIP